MASGCDGYFGTGSQLAIGARLARIQLRFRLTSERSGRQCKKQVQSGAGGSDMKVVLFCGGLGLRIRDAEDIPKPMVQIGYRPVLWHVMKYYAHFGHTDFILCLGHRADAIKKYFLDYNECTSNDFVLSDGGKKVELFNSDIRDWRITFADTGINSNIGQRL